MEFIAKLHQLQQNDNLRLANKLKTHVNWFKQKMKVNLAEQTLSSSVANDYCNETLKDDKSSSSETTVKF